MAFQGCSAAAVNSWNDSQAKSRRNGISGPTAEVVNPNHVLDVIRRYFQCR